VLEGLLKVQLWVTCLSSGCNVETWLDKTKIESGLGPYFQFCWNPVFCGAVYGGVQVLSCVLWCCA